MKLDGNIALVTGASRGIGAAIADALAAAGARVVGTATTGRGAEAITQRLAAAAKPGRGAVLNLGEREQVAALADSMKDAPGMPLILVNNAGITRDGLMMRMKDAQWDEVIAANLSGAWRLCRACLPAMIKARWGRIINIGSVVGTMGNAGQSNYAASKAGLAGMGRALAREVGARGITVNCIAPGFVSTDMTDALSDDQQSALSAQIPLRRFGRPDEIARLALFLAGDGGAYITGETIHIDGGMAMR